MPSRRYLFVPVFCFLLEALCQTGSATTYTKHKCLHPPRTKNKNKPSNPTRSPSPPQQLRQGPKKATGSAQETNQEARASEHEQTKNGQATQAEAQHSHSNSGQRPKSHGEKAGNEPGGERTRPAHGSESKRGGAASCNPGSCRAVAEKTGQRPPVGAPHGVRDDGRTDERTDDQAPAGAWPGGCGVLQDPVPMR